jgi:hypothetical protein
MHELFDYEGRRIRLSGERYTHILEHPEMTCMPDTIGEVVAHPERVVESIVDRSVRLYYRLYEQTMVGRKYVCVVVKITNEDAFVLTAYLTDRVKRGVLLWPNEN